MNPILVLLVVLAVVVGPDCYIRFSLLGSASLGWRLVWWLPSLLLFATLLLARRHASNWLFVLLTGLVLCVVLPKLLFALLSVTGRLLSLAWPQVAAPFHWTALVVAAGVSLAALYGMTIGWRHLAVRQVELSFDNLPADFEGYRIVQLSDLHVGTYGRNPRFLQRLVETVNQQQADAIVLTGDIVNTRPDELSPFVSVLSQLHARDGVFSVLGNHDYSLYATMLSPASRRDEVHRLVAMQRAMGWQVLLNEHRLVRCGDSQIAIAGVENTGKPPFPKIGDLQGALKGLPDSTFVVLLSHDPSHWRMEVLPDTDIPLTLSGHTHASQFKVGRWSPSVWLYKEWSGLYLEQGQQLYVSEGVGGTIPFRLGTRPEINVLTLHRIR